MSLEEMKAAGRKASEIEAARHELETDDPDVYRDRAALPDQAAMDKLLPTIARIQRPFLPLAKRFWSKIKAGNPDECWPWLEGTTIAGNYGEFTFMGRTVLSHRFAYELEVGPLRPRQELYHICDSTLCCNPAHLTTEIMVQKQCAMCGAYYQKEKRRANMSKFCSRSCLATFYNLGKAPITVSEFLDEMKESEGCWEWPCARDRDGYGKAYDFRMKKQRRAHVIALELVSGCPVASGMFVCHTCDNPPCVNPSHLFVGTLQDNVNDMVKKRRNAHGERSPLHKLTEAQILEIRSSAIDPGILAERFGISRVHIKRVRNGHHWKHLL